METIPLGPMGLVSKKQAFVAKMLERRSNPARAFFSRSLPFVRGGQVG